MNKLPAIQFYPSDWKSDPGVQSLSFEDRGIWFEMLLLMHESPRRGVLLLPNGAKLPNDALSRILGCPLPKLVKALDRIAAVGVSSIDEESGSICNRRMVKDERLRLIRTEAGRLGGNPNLVKQNTTKEEAEGNQDDKQTSTPSSSSSSSNKKHIANASRYSSEFEDFWGVSSKRGSKYDASLIYQRLSEQQRPLARNAMISSVRGEWRGIDRQYIPHVVKWLRGERWENQETKPNGIAGFTIREPETDNGIGFEF